MLFTNAYTFKESLNSTFYMDRSWTLDPNRVSTQYLKGIDGFIEHAKKHVDRHNKIKCPCQKCRNLIMMKVKMTKMATSIIRNYSFSTSVSYCFVVESKMSKHKLMKLINRLSTKTKT